MVSSGSTRSAWARSDRVTARHSVSLRRSRLHSDGCSTTWTVTGMPRRSA